MAQRSASYLLVSSVMSSAGAPGVSIDVHTVGSLGQPTPIGIGQDHTRTLYAGFWGLIRKLILSDAPAPEALLYQLFQNAPNPFNPATVIEFMVAEAGPVRLEIYDLRGTHVRTLVAEDLPVGLHQVSWDGRDDAGRGVASGVYCYRLRAGRFGAVRKMMLLK